MTFLLHVRYSPEDPEHTITFGSAFARSLLIITLASLPVVVRLEDRAVTS